MTIIDSEFTDLATPSGPMRTYVFRPAAPDAVKPSVAPGAGAGIGAGTAPGGGGAAPTDDDKDDADDKDTGDDTDPKTEDGDTVLKMPGAPGGPKPSLFKLRPGAGN